MVEKMLRGGGVGWVNEERREKGSWGVMKHRYFRRETIHLGTSILEGKKEGTQI